MRNWLRNILHFDHWVVATLALVLTGDFGLLFFALSLKHPYLKSVSLVGGGGGQLGGLGLKADDPWKADTTYQFLDDIESDSISCYLIE